MVKKVEWGVSEQPEKEAGVGAGPESHGRGVDCFVGVAVGGDIV